MNKSEQASEGQYCTCCAMQGQCHVKGRNTAAEWMDLTEVPWLQSSGAAQHSMLICRLVHQAVEIWWPEDKSYYRGTVTAYLTERVGPDTPPQSNMHCQHGYAYQC